MACTDKSMTALAGLGYNVVRHPSANFRPLMLIGKQKGEFLQLGALNQLITNGPGPLPAVTLNQPGAGIQGQSSSKLDISVGASILGSLIGAMGGNLGINVSYTNARQVEFKYTNVTLDSVEPLDVGNYLRDGHVDAGNLILQQYVLGNGELFVVTKVAKSKTFSVSYTRSGSSGVTVDVPALQALAGANVKVGASGASSSLVTFDGDTPLGFAFQCFQVGVVEGVLSLTSVKAGGVTAAVPGGPPMTPELLGAGLQDVR